MSAPPGTRSSAGLVRPFDREKYLRDMREHFQKIGEPIGEALLERDAAEYERENNELQAGRCPKCGAPAVAYFETGAAQRKPESWLPGEGGCWVNFRCSRDNPPLTPQPPDRCGFMVDARLAS